MRHEFRPSVESSGPISTLLPLFGCMGNFFPHPLRLPFPGRPSLLSAQRGDHFPASLLRRYIAPLPPPPLRPSLQGWLRLSLRPSLRGPVSPEGDQSPPQRRLRAWRFADIPIRPPIQNTRGALVSLWIFSASLALDACAIASALASQRFPISLAVALLSFAFAVLAARLVSTRRFWRSG